MPPFDRYGYGPVASIYDELAAFYSRGRIPATKRLALDWLKPGDRVLFPGVGRGEEAVEAARRGVSVTGVDISTAMLRRTERALQRAGLEAKLLEADASIHRPNEPYDAVVAHYFLNLFEAARAREMLGRLGALVKPRGLLVLSDFAPSCGRGLGRGLTSAYYRPVNLVAWLLGLCAFHPIHDYPRMLESMPFRILSERRLAVAWGADPAYLSIVAERLPD
jgi:ubiquinone/menaquinone biosynthesis C-methylase UbiE